MSDTRFPPGEYLSDELEARGWTTRYLAEQMTEAVGGSADVWQLTVDLLIASPDVTLGDETAEALAAVFGGHAQTWLNLDAAYRRKE